MTYRTGTIITIVLSYLLRARLVLSGGQFYWPDEVRYEASRAAARALRQAHVTAFLQALDQPDHPLFRVFGIIPAVVEQLAGANPKVPALFFSLFGVANLWLLWRILRRAGESDRVAFLAVSLLACCSTALYYSRHLLPYDTALSTALLALYVGMRKPARPRDSVLCGLLAAGAFLAYSGYWLIAGFSLLVHVSQEPRRLTSITRRLALAGGASAAVLLTPFALSQALGGDLLDRFLAFSRSAAQGVYSEGWSLPFAYLWHAEHGLLLLWGVALALGLRNAVLGSRRQALLLSLAGIASVYAGLVVCSVALQWFVVYGRLVRQLVPFCCVLSALLLDALWCRSNRCRLVAMLVWMGACLQAAANFQAPLSQVFPPEFIRQAARAYARSEGRAYQVLFAEHIYPYPASPAVEGETILKRPHPLSYLPYQYEGYTPDQRAALRSTDISMRLVRRTK